MTLLIRPTSELIKNSHQNIAILDNPYPFSKDTPIPGIEDETLDNKIRKAAV